MEPIAGLNRDTYVLWVCRQIWEELPRILGSGFLFSLCCVPAFVLFALGYLAPTVLVSVVTVAPGWAALLAVQRNIVSDGALPAVSFGRAFSQYWRRSTQLGAMAAFPLLAALITLPALQQPPIPLVVWLGLGADLLGMAMLAALLLYAFPLMVYTDAGAKTGLRKGWLLAALYPWHTLGLLGLGILLAFSVGYVSIGLLFLLPALYGMFVMGNALLVLHRGEQERALHGANSDAIP
ncbi:MAG: hypothetical protein R3E79_21315 [Caldilineaceae bacterium]